jgi:acyl-CoA reductase-like NAD-dependent aldehyde dehydrogenase
VSGTPPTAATDKLVVVNPATEEVIEAVAAASDEDVSSAVAAAQRAYVRWSTSEPKERARMLRRVARRIEERGEEIAQIETRNVGKPIRDAREEVEMAADLFDFYAGGIDKHYGETIPIKGGIDVTFHEPLGVVAMIVPWNFPFNTACAKLAPALACGNTAVLKPAELTPLSTLILAEIVVEAGIPDGVVEVVVGPGSVVGEQLVRDPRVAKVSFTGSTDVGRRVMELASATLKRLSLELGGKSANIVFADADLEAAAAAAPMAAFGNAGQDCCARSRILIERSAYDRFLELLVAAAAKVSVGSPESPETEMGPLISAEHRRKVASYVDGGVVFEGNAPPLPGYWFPPTILAPVTNDVRAAREEIFGPVACVIPFASEAEAVALANDSSYGLSGSLWTRDVERALRVARGVETGAFSVNSNTSVFVAAPFGGVKQSGFGRENGMRALDEYSSVKNVYFAIRPPS